MNTFLKYVATDLINKYGDHLSDIAVVFPNKRATLFLNEQLAQLAQRPVWSPHYFTISELFKNHSRRQVADQIKLVCELYKVYTSVTGSEDTLDKFYGWGEMLLSDFDDIDKNKVQAKQLFLNLEELHSFDSFDFLNEEELRILKDFFHNIKFDEKTELKEKFKKMWKHLYTIYEVFNTSLKEQGLAYEGALYREVVEDDSWKPRYKHYVFVGFNVLNKVETALFSRLKKEGCAHFYWDYDKYYVENKKFEAGEFIRRNLELFPNEFDKDSDAIYSNLEKSKNIAYVAATTETVQAVYVNDWIKKNHTEKENETAVVLCNENLLESVLHSFSTDVVQQINITTGYPLSKTTAANFMKLFLTLQNEGFSEKNKIFYIQYVLQMLNHPYTSLISKEANDLHQFLMKEHHYYPTLEELHKDAGLKLLFTHYTNNQEMVEAMIQLTTLLARAYKEKKEESSQLHEESIFRIFTLLQRLNLLLEAEDLSVNIYTFTKLFAQLLDGTSIPFHGEPAVGLQVMGVLETRNLDFKNLLLLSVNEGKLPKTNNFSSFIPYNLRKAFGLTTIEHKEAVFAYYFYRLLQRAENVTLLYNTSTDGMNKGEMSRFMLQYQIESGQDIKHYQLQSEQEVLTPSSFVVKKTSEMLSNLQRTYDVNAEARILSPTALNAYLDCPMKFYFRYVLKLKTPENDALNVDSPTFGSVFHFVAEHLYLQLKNQQDIVTPEMLKMVLKEKDNVVLKKLIDKAYAKEVFNLKDWETANVSRLYNGLQLISRNAIISYMKLLLKIDIQVAPFKVLGLEKMVSNKFNIKTKKGDFIAKIGGIIDRLDQISISGKETVRVIDYKTSKAEQKASSIEDLFIQSEKRSEYIFQAILYSSIVRLKTEKEVAPAILYIQKGAQKDFDPIIEIGASRKKEKMNDVAVYLEEFYDLLSKTLNEIFDETIDFKQTEVRKKCTFCPFLSLCKTNVKQENIH